MGFLGLSLEVSLYLCSFVSPSNHLKQSQTLGNRKITFSSEINFKKSSFVLFFLHLPYWLYKLATAILITILVDCLASAKWLNAMKTRSSAHACTRTNIHTQELVHIRTQEHKNTRKSCLHISVRQTDTHGGGLGVDRAKCAHENKNKPAGQSSSDTYDHPANSRSAHSERNASIKRVSRVSYPSLRFAL